MKKPLFPFFIFLFVLAGCIFQKERYKPAQFSYTQDGRDMRLPMVVPKGFNRQEKTDTAGVLLHTFYYPNGAMLYAAYVQDTLTELQPFDKRMHQPQVHRLGGLVYKGQDEKELYYREIRQGALRFGYRNVPGTVELQFDSATNFASLQRQ